MNTVALKVWSNSERRVDEEKNEAGFFMKFFGQIETLIGTVLTARFRHVSTSNRQIRHFKFRFGIYGDAIRAKRRWRGVLHLKDYIRSVA